MDIHTGNKNKSQGGVAWIFGRGAGITAEKAQHFGDGLKLDRASMQQSEQLFVF